MKLAALTHALHHAGLRPKQSPGLPLVHAVCPACWPQTQGGRWLTLTGDNWPDITCANQACPTNPPADEARAELTDDMRTLAAGGTPPLRGVWPHLGRVLGADVVAQLIRQQPDPKTTTTHRTLGAVPRIHPPRITV